MSESGEKMPSWSNVVLAVGKVTFTEILYDRVLYNVILCAFLLFGAGFLASRLTFIRPERVVLDFGILAVTLSSTAIAVLIGAGLISREFERRTIHVALSHPITKGQFVLGKFFGISSILTLNWVLLSISYCALLSMLQGMGPTFSNSALFPALFLALLQSLVMAALAIFLSTFSTTSLSVVMAVGVYLVGQNISALRLLISQVGSAWVRGILDVVVSIPPNLEYFNLGLRLTYGLPVGVGLVVKSVFYAALLAASCILAAGFAIRQKEV